MARHRSVGLEFHEGTGNIELEFEHLDSDKNIFWIKQGDESLIHFNTLNDVTDFVAELKDFIGRCQGS